jgi:geranylgeranyl diphosphate synthase type I
MPPMHDHAAFKHQVEAVLATFLETQLAGLTEVSEQLAPFAEQVRVAVGSGKRLRAAFCYWGWRAAGQPDCRGVIRAAAAMELVHAAAVVHDDIIDDSAQRHGVPSAHIALGSLIPDYPERGHGAVLAARGAGLALLLGNMLIAWSAQLFAECGLPAPFVARARPLWASLARDLVAGEALEVLCTRRPASVEQALTIMRLKTAKYTVEQPLHLGGLLAGAPVRALTAFTDYGLPLGEAFQLRDDLLGVFGDPRHTGKPNHDDMSGGKPTVLLALTRAAAAHAQRVRLDQLVGRPDLTIGEADEIRAIMRACGVPEQVDKLARERVDQALAVLDRAGFNRETDYALRAMANSAYRRTN